MATLGTTSVGGTNGALNFNNEFAHGPYEAVENGTVTHVSVYFSSINAGLTRLGIWEDTGSGYPGDLIGETDAAALATGWITLSCTGSLVQGTSYYIGHIQNNNVNVPYDAGTKEIVLKAKTFGPLSDPYPAAGTEVASRNYSAYITYVPTGTSSLTITTPVTKKLFQKSGTTASIAITGTATGFTGAIEARFAGGAWQTITTIVGDGAYSGTLTGQALAAGTLEVRSALVPAATASVADIMTGSLYLVSGDSIAEGRLTNSQSRNSVNAVVFRQDDGWAFADDPTDTGTVGGSHWPLLAQLLTSHFGHPVGFVTTATGSTDIAGFSTYYQKPNAGWSIITSQYTQSGGSIEAVLMHLGPNAAVGDTLTQAEYLSALTTFAANIRADVQAAVPIYLGVYGRSNNTLAGNPKIRRAIAEAISSGIVSCGPNLLGPNWSDGVHPKSDADAITVAGRWFAAITGTAAPRIISAELGDSSSDVDITFNSDLAGSNGATYTATLFTVNGDNPTTATKVSDRLIRLAFATARADGQTVVYVPAEQHIGGTMPTSVSVALPVTIHSVSTAVQPADPISTTVSSPGVDTSSWFVFDQLLDDSGNPLTSAAAVLIRAEGATSDGAGVLEHIGGGIWEYQSTPTEILADGETVLILYHASTKQRQIIRVTRSTQVYLDVNGSGQVTADSFADSAIAKINQHRSR